MITDADIAHWLDMIQKRNVTPYLTADQMERLLTELQAHRKLVDMKQERGL